MPTPVTVALTGMGPEQTMVIAEEIVTLAFADIVIVAPLIELMVVLAGMGPVLTMGSAVVMV